MISGAWSHNHIFHFQWGDFCLMLCAYNAQCLCTGLTAFMPWTSFMNEVHLKVQIIVSTGSGEFGASIYSTTQIGLNGHGTSANAHEGSMHVTQGW